MKLLYLMLLSLVPAPAFAAQIIDLTDFPFSNVLFLNDEDLRARVSGVDWVWIDRPEVSARLGLGGDMEVFLAFNVSSMSRLDNLKDGTVRFLLRAGDGERLLLSIEDLGFVTTIDPPGDTVKFTVRRLIFDAEVLMLTESQPDECARELEFAL